MVQGLSNADIRGIWQGNNPALVFDVQFGERFGVAPPDQLNTSHVLTIIASGLDTSTERIVTYLNATYSVPINTVFFRYFLDGDRSYLARTWLIDEAGPPGATTAQRDTCLRVVYDLEIFAPYMQQYAIPSGRTIDLLYTTLTLVGGKRWWLGSSKCIDLETDFLFAALLGLSGALVLGGADFMGGIAAKGIGALRTTAIMSVVGVVGVVTLSLVFRGIWTEQAVLWGAASGISGSLSIVLLYGCLSLGPMSVLSPLTAVVGAIVPMSWGLAHGEQLKPFGYLALGLALVAVVLVGVAPGAPSSRASARGIGMAVASGTLGGAFLITLNFAPHNSQLVPLIVNRAVSATFIVAALGLLLLFHRRARAFTGTLGSRVVLSNNSSVASTGAISMFTEFIPQATKNIAMRRSAVLLACACGIADTVGAAFVLTGLRVGDLSVMGVLGALYPVGTIVLAAAILKERIVPVQWLGLVFALTSAALLGLA